MKGFSWVRVVPAAFLLAGCDFTPAYTPPATTLPRAFKEAGRWQPARPADREPRGPWWTAFRDKTLNALEPQVDTANQTLAEAYATYALSRTQVREAEAALLPNLDQVSQFTTDRQSLHRTYRSLPSNQPTHYGDNRLAIQSSYEVDLWGRVRDTVKASADEAQARAALLGNARLSLHAQLARDYIALRGIDRDLQLVRDTVKAFDQARALTEQRLQGKIAAPMDVERAKAELEIAKALIDDDLARRALLEHAIAVLVGQPASSFSIAEAPVAVLAPRGPRAAPSTLLERRPDIAAAEREVAAANEGIGVARSAFYPRFFINLYAGTQDRGVRLLDLVNELYTIGPSVTIPIFDGGLRRAELDAARLRRDAAVARYRQVILTAIREVEDALSTQRNLNSEGRRIAAAVASERKVLDQSLTLYRDGATTYLDVVVAQEALLGQQRSSLGLLTRGLDASVSLFVALGGGWSNEQIAATKPD